MSNESNPQPPKAVQVLPEAVQFRCAELIDRTACVYLVICDNFGGHVNYSNPVRAFYDPELAEKYKGVIEKKYQGLTVEIYPSYPYVSNVELNED